MKSESLQRLLHLLYSPEFFEQIGVENPQQFTHQPAVIAQAWKRLAKTEQSGIILADEVGLGKTYEALGLLYFYLMDRLIRKKKIGFKVLIILPPNLLSKWEDEVERFTSHIQLLGPFLEPRFHLIADMLQHELIGATEIVARFPDGKPIAGNKVLTSNQNGVFFIKETLFKNYFGDANKKSLTAKHAFKKIIWDCVIVDEAHNYARQYNQRGQAVHAFSEQARSVGAKIILCTATPFQLDTSELIALIEIIESNAGRRTAVEEAISAYNTAVEKMRQSLQFDELKSDPNTHAILQRTLSVAKQELESRLKPYILRTRRPERDGREQRHYSYEEVQPGYEFPWLYWRVKDWMRLLSISGNTRLRTFLPATLQITLSSRNALLKHLDNKGEYSNFAKEANQTRRELQSLLKKNISIHPKFEALRSFIANRVEKVSESFSSDIPNLSQFKCVIFIRHIATINALNLPEEGVVKAAEQLSENIQMQNHLILSGLSIDPVVFSRKLEKAVIQSLPRIQQEYHFDLPVLPNIWETAYEGQVNEFQHMRRVKWGTADDLSKYRASELRAMGQNALSITQELLQNLKLKFREPQTEYAMIQKIKNSNRNKSGWDETLNDLVYQWMDMKLGYLLTPIKKLYYGNDLQPDQPREWLRLRLSRLVYSLRPRNVIESLTGDMDLSIRQQIINSFNNDLYPIFLLSTSVGEEGVDLQRQCNTIVHYDLEWNPAKVEQREGRVDRLGRETSSGQVQVRTIKLVDTYDERILARCENRKLWMDLYLCKAWIDEGKKTEEEVAQSDTMPNLPSIQVDNLRNYRLDLSPEPHSMNL